MRPIPRVTLAAAMLALGACGTGAQQSQARVLSADRELADLAGALLPDLARRSGLEIKEPVRLEKRSREALVAYLRHKLDEELPEAEARVTVASYALLGLVPESLDLRAVLLDLYTEQVAGFYDPDSTALFILDDQPAAALQGLLVHELVHAVQDQSADLKALTDPAVGNDRSTAAQAAIEGHATLVMLEFLTEEMRGAPVDLADVPDFAASVRPALEGMRSQFPALAQAPRVIQEALLFPYLEGAGFVQDLWTHGDRVAPFGAHLPASTEQVVTRDRTDAPVTLALTVAGARAIHQDDLGRLEVGVLLEQHLGRGGQNLAAGWGGDRYALLELDGGGTGLVWATVWDDAAARDRFVRALSAALGAFPREATLAALDVAGAPGAVLRVGLPAAVAVGVARAP